MNDKQNGHGRRGASSPTRGGPRDSSTRGGPRDSSSTGRGRRDFLQRVLIAGGATALGGAGLGTLARLARGQEEGVDDRFYVFAYFGGGWDTILGIDPRMPGDPEDPGGSGYGGSVPMGNGSVQAGYEFQQEARFQEVPRVVPGTEIFLGPAARPLEGVPDGRLAVVRGMSMDTLTHQVGRRRFLTGKPPSGLQARGSAGSAWLASQFDGSRLIPNLSVRVESFNPDLASEVSALRVSTPSDLVELLGPSGEQLDPEIASAIAALQEAEANCPRSLASPILRTSESARQRLKGVLEADVREIFDFDAAPSARTQAAHDHFLLTGRERSTLHERAAIAGQAITHGVSRVVTFQATGSLDTHFDNWETDQAPRQYAGFDAVTRLAQYLDAQEYAPGESYLDRTVIVGFSEFMRSPLLNARGGRDHWLTNSCFLMGGNIKGGAIIGASSDEGMAPQPVDLATGAVVPSGDDIVRPEHIWRTLLVDAGLEDDLADLRVPTIPALLRA